jgi:sec-independent protein translocase protein TatA
VLKGKVSNMRLGSPELIVVLAIVLILFGVGRVSRLGEELGSAIKAFRKGAADTQLEEHGTELEV